TLRSMGDLAYSLKGMGKPAEAVTLYRQSQADRQRILVPEHIETLRCEVRLGELLRRTSKLVEAEKLLRHCLDVGRRTCGPDHAETIKSLDNLASVLRARGQLVASAESVMQSAESVTLYRELLKIREKKNGPEHEATLAVLELLANFLEELGQ